MNLKPEKIRITIREKKESDNDKPRLYLYSVVIEQGSNRIEVTCTTPTNAATLALMFRETGNQCSLNLIEIS